MNGGPVKPVVLCADDFGMTEGISRAILELARQGRISATSVMPGFPAWERHAAALRELTGRVGIGLHVNLTLGRSLGTGRMLAPAGQLPPLSRLVALALSGRLPRQELEAEIERQCDAFEARLGRRPDFVDGHQHVHALPGVRGALIAVLRRRGWSCWLRDPAERAAAIVKRRVAARKAMTVKLLSAGFGREARAAGHDTNQGFSGFSALAEDTAAGPVLEAALSHLGPRPLVMVHPGYVDDELRGLDPVQGSRESERAYLASDQFAALLLERSLALVPAPMD
jgi:chitin disaccharide deacetylase